MKKNYIKPNIREFRLVGQPILTGSQLNPSNDNPNVTPDPNEEITGGFGSRRRSEWDYEEEEDF